MARGWSRTSSQTRWASGRVPPVGPHVRTYDRVRRFAATPLATPICTLTAVRGARREGWADAPTATASTNPAAAAASDLRSERSSEQALRALGPGEDAGARVEDGVEDVDHEVADDDQQRDQGDDRDGPVEVERRRAEELDREPAEPVDPEGGLDVDRDGDRGADLHPDHRQDAKPGARQHVADDQAGLGCTLCACSADVVLGHRLGNVRANDACVEGEEEQREREPRERQVFAPVQWPATGHGGVASAGDRYPAMSGKRAVAPRG